MHSRRKRAPRLGASSKETLDLYRSIADNAYDWIYWRSADGMLLYVSASGERVTGYSPQEFQDHPDLLVTIVHPDDATLFKSHLAEEGSENSIPPFDYRIVTRDGATRWINHACSAVLDGKGRLLGRRATNRDVSERKELEEEVESLARFPAENPNPVLRTSADGLIMYANQAGTRLIELWKRTVGVELPPSIRKIISESATAPGHRDVDIECEDRVFAFDAIRPEGAAYINIYGADVTERRRAEGKLRAARDELDQQVRDRTAELRRTNRLLRMISACNQALVGIDDERELVQAICQLILDEGGFRMAWVGYAEQTGARMVRPVGSAGFEDGYLENAAITWEDTERGRGPTGTAIRECRPCISTDFLTQPELAPWRDDALQRGFRSSVALPLVSQGSAFGALTIYSDQPSAFDRQQQTLLTELSGDLAFGILSVRARAQRDQAQQSLEHRTALLRSLAVELVQAEERERRRIGGVLHDQLQQLLAGARFGLESLRSADSTEGVRETIEKIDGMIQEGLAVTRSLTTELSPPVHYSADLHSVMQWLVAWAHERFGLHVTVETEGEMRVDSEEVRMVLFRAVQELLFNVAKHAGVKEACISINRRGQQLHVIVRDTGRGFNPAAIRARGGSAGGFGLFSLQERLEALGASMRIDSAPGQGSSFVVQVPVDRVDGRLVPRPAATARAPASGPEGNRTESERCRADPGSKIRVLLVDDHLVVRQGLAMVLGGEPDIEIVGEASDGRSAIELARKLHPDVVTMDVGLPGMDGIEATRIIHAELPGIAIIGLSMFEDQKDAMERAGAVEYLPKTGASPNLLAAIRCACRKTPT